MTIDSTWLSSFKEEAAHAFTPSCTIRPKAVFCDGQIHLMQGAPGEPQTWDAYISRQFLRPVEKFFGMCDVVILAFDNYAHVPASKAMTQTKRKKRAPVVSFSESQTLPCMVPEGERWMGCIANRTFKAKVIDLIMCRLPEMVLSKYPRKQLIIDYQAPLLYQLRDGEVTASEIDGLRSMGEADVKFVSLCQVSRPAAKQNPRADVEFARYADLYEKLLIDSIDGDTVPIALLHHETCLARGECPPKMSVYRMEINLEKTEKRKKGRSYEYLDVHALYEALRTAVLQSTGRAASLTHAGHEVRMLCSLVAITGTDFSRNLPYITGKTVFETLPVIWMTLCSCYDPASQQLDASKTADSLLALLYHLKFSRHTKSKRGVDDVLSEIQAAPKISELTKSRMPTPERLRVTVLNVNWVLQYWRCEAMPDPVSSQFGYAVRAGVPCYQDLV